MIIVLTTFEDEATAAVVIQNLIEERLIACGTMIPQGKSIYFWEGKIEEKSEVIVLLKTKSILQSACMERLNELHPYNIPEIIAIEPRSVSEPYAAWVKNFTCNL